mmetsp:Transcript_18663/g.37882  ORF Transcript_18663/g.37882 Transcript_18663/m.37882 type:complete len:286 (+) Transcript_18663:216-1073(+)
MRNGIWISIRLHHHVISETETERRGSSSTSGAVQYVRPHVVRVYARFHARLTAAVGVSYSVCVLAHSNETLDARVSMYSASIAWADTKFHVSMWKSCSRPSSASSFARRSCSSRPLCSRFARDALAFVSMDAMRTAVSTAARCCFLSFPSVGLACIFTSTYANRGDGSRASSTRAHSGSFQYLWFLISSAAAGVFMCLPPPSLFSGLHSNRPLTRSISASSFLPSSFMNLGFRNSDLWSKKRGSSPKGNSLSLISYSSTPSVNQSAGAEYFLTPFLPACLTSGAM